MEDQHAERLTARTRELMAESGLSGRQAQAQAEDELEAHPELRPQSSDRATTRFKLILAVTGFVLTFVPGIVSLIVRPGWMTASSSQDEATGGAVYLALLALSGLVVVAIGVRFGLAGRARQGWAVMGYMAPGVYFGTVIWFVAGVNSAGVNSSDVGLILVGAFVPIMAYGVCAAWGIVLGSGISEMRSE
jgi:hypothetical protein